MNEQAPVLDLHTDADDVLLDLMERMTERVQLGQDVDVEAGAVRPHPAPGHRVVPRPGDGHPAHRHRPSLRDDHIDGKLVDKAFQRFTQGVGAAVEALEKRRVRLRVEKRFPADRISFRIAKVHRRDKAARRRLAATNIRRNLTASSTRLKTGTPPASAR